MPFLLLICWLFTHLLLMLYNFVKFPPFIISCITIYLLGRAVLGLVRESETEKITLEPGDMIHIPAGTPLYIVNRDENEKLLLAMLHIPVSTPGKFEVIIYT